MTAFVLFLVLTSAWITDRIGVCVLLSPSSRSLALAEHELTLRSIPFPSFLPPSSFLLALLLAARLARSHAIFGAFLVGLVVPKEIRAPLTEKIEDLVTVLFLPLYFALSGLKTDLGLLSDGSIWGWVVCVCVVAFASSASARSSSSPPSPLARARAGRGS